MPCTLPKANGYLRGCHGSWLITSVSSRRCRAAASRPLAHMLTQPPNGQSATFHISQIPAEGVSTSPPTLEPSRLASTIKKIKKKTACDAALPWTASTLPRRSGYGVWVCVRGGIDYEARQQFGWSTVIKRDVYVPGGWARAVSNLLQLAT